jgi:hypothetical protein
LLFDAGPAWDMFGPTNCLAGIIEILSQFPTLRLARAHGVTVKHMTHM